MSNDSSILLVGIIATFLASVVTTAVTIYYSRKNLHTSKYIDTITASRIKWLEVLRNEIIELTTNIYRSIKIYRADIENRKFERGDHPDISDNPYENALDAITSAAFGEERYTWSESDFIQKINLIKLRLNYQKDISIIATLDFFSGFYKDSKFISEKKVIHAEEMVNQLVSDAQLLLKKEWEKCKKETKNH